MKSIMKYKPLYNTITVESYTIEIPKNLLKPIKKLIITDIRKNRDIAFDSQKEIYIEVTEQTAICYTIIHVHKQKYRVINVRILNLSPVQIAEIEQKLLELK